MKTYLTTIICLFANILIAKDFNGFFNYNYNEQNGKVSLKIKEFDKEFLLVNYYGSGLGSNDIGFDRGKITAQRLVKFKRFGNRVALIQSNPFYRAITNNEMERKAAEDAFGSSILFTFIIESENEQGATVDLTLFLTEDLNNTVGDLKESKQGNYKLEKSKCLIIPEEMHAFPDNIEFETWMTYVGESTGDYIKTVSPVTEVISLRQHTSFVRLPEKPHAPRLYHPYSGYFDMSFYDYATAIHEPIEKKYILRHRLEKKNSNVAKSEAVEPIIYYVDPGCPEPIKSALIEGASWWNQAYEEAGFINAFQVKELPKDAHPLDVRYNTIQWVHRSTRGWSYGSNIHDPRTGEIIKGHVTLGSLRVRQDFMIAQGLLSIYEGKANNHSPMIAMALARLRQLSAHEVGHTIGLAHNFAASYNDRASVMDYPHPLAEIGSNSKINLDKAYDNKIGLWDKRAIKYGYEVFTSNEKEGLQNIISDTKRMGLKYLSDPDSRPDGSAAADGHLWDNGKDPMTELERVMNVRKLALSNFGLNTISEGTPVSELEKVLVPLYHAQRYQVEAVSKIVGGSTYGYAVKGDEIIQPFVPSTKEDQKKAIGNLIKTIDADNLMIPQNIRSLLMPNAYGYAASRESFKNETGYGFDQIAAASSQIDHVMALLFNEQRLARINNQSLFSLKEYFGIIHNLTNKHDKLDRLPLKLSLARERAFFMRLLKLIQNIKKAELSSAAMAYMSSFNRPLTKAKKGIADNPIDDHYNYIYQLYNGIKQGEEISLPSPMPLPPGAPIGCY